MKLVEISKKLKIAPATVSRALNPHLEHLVAEKTRKRIQKFAQKHNYVANRTAKELVMGRTNTIGVLHATQFQILYAADHSHKFLDGLYSVMEKNVEYHCKFVMLPWQSKISESDRQILSTNVDGLLIYAQTDHLHEEIRKLIRTLVPKWKKPIVTLNLDPFPKSKVSHVYFSNYEGAELAMTHLIKTGRKHIGFIHGMEQYFGMQERRRAYIETLRDHRLPVKNSYMEEGGYHVEPAYQATIQLVNNNHKLDAIFCTTDQMAIGVFQALRSLKIKCPQDIAVMGFDGLEMGAYLNPALTTIYQPTTDITKDATQLLLDLIEEKEKGPVFKKFDCRLLSRQSA